MPVEIPPAFRAAEIALHALKQNRESTWADLAKSGKDPRLTGPQLSLVEQEMTVVSQLQIAVGRQVSVTYCPECGRLAFIGMGAGPAKCTLTYKCTGKPEKASATPARSKKAEGENDGAASAGE